MGKFIDLTGKKFGELTVISQAEHHNGRVQWNCECDCGESRKVGTKELRNGEIDKCKNCVIRHINCKFCGQVAKNEFCSDACMQKFQEMINKPFKTFYSYKHAAQYFNKDHRTLKKWENILYKIDKNLKSDFNAIQWKICKICGNKTESAKCRMGYCKKCSKEGLGHIEAGKILSELYKGKGNPNYVHGKKMEHLRERSAKHGKWTRKILKEKPNICMLSGRTENLHIHHVLGFSLFPQLRYKIWNGIILNRFYHIELHRQKLDLLLLPILCSLSLQDVQELIPECLRLPQLQSLLQLPYQIHNQHELLRVVGGHSNYPKQLSRLRPQFDQSELALLESRLVNLEASKIRNLNYSPIPLQKEF